MADGGLRFQLIVRSIYLRLLENMPGPWIPAFAGIGGDRVQRCFWVYLLASYKNGTLYCGHTDDLARRIFAHREGRGSLFTRKYRVTKLVWCEAQETREAAKHREYQIKKWKRAWKIRLIEDMNPAWDDLFLRLNQ